MSTIKSVVPLSVGYLEYACRGGPSAFALPAIDIALRDLEGKPLDQSGVDLLGGADRDRLAAVASTHVFNPSIEYQARRRGRHIREQGYMSAKVGMGKRAEARSGYDCTRDIDFVRTDAIGSTPRPGRREKHRFS